MVFLFAGLLHLGPGASSASAAGASLTVTPKTWNIIGLDSSKPSVSNGRPNEFPVGAKVCNTGDVAATSVQATFAWTTSNPNISLSTPSTTGRTVGELAPGACAWVTYNVLVNRNQQSFTNRTRGYQITASAAGGLTASTPAGRELYVEKLVRQNRNAVVGITSPACSGTSCTVYKGQTYRFTLTARTATQGYEQLQAFVNFPDSIFEIKDIRTTYAAPKGAINDSVYADACGWDNVPTSATYRKCVGPTGYPGGKAGGNPIRTTYTVKIVGTGSGTLSGLVYDFSGSSFHYNADFSSGLNSVSFTAANAADLSVTKSHSGAFVRGSTGTYSLTARNDGPSTSGSITVTDTLPAGLRYASFSGTNWSCVGCSGASQTVTLVHPALASGASSTVALEVDVLPTAGSSLTNIATISQPTSSTFNDPVGGNNSASDPTTVADPGDADLVLTKTSDDVFTPGGEATYELNVRNDGPSSATGPITLTDTLPAGLTFVSASGNGWSCSVDGQVVTCARPTGLAAGEATPTLTLVVEVAAGASSRLTNTTSVTAASDNDPNESNNVNVIDAVLVGRADLWIEKSHSGSLPRGGTGSYTIMVGNDGPDAADTPRVVDTLPSGLTFASASGTGWNCSNSGQVVTCNSASDLAAGATATPLTINVGVASGASSTVTNTATVCSVMEPGSVSGCPDQDRGTFEVDPADNSVDDLTATAAQTDLSLTKTSSVSSVNTGTNFTYTIQVTNSGPNSATNVTVVDTLPKHIDPATVTTNPGTSNTSTAPYCDVVELEVTCVFGTIGTAAGSNTASATITVRALATGAGRTLVNTASVFSDLGDTNHNNDTATASVSINGTLVNATPTVSDASASVSHLSQPGVDIFLSGSDADGDPLTFGLPWPNGGALHGTVTISGSVATYVPSGDFVGTDTFEYVANDGTVDSAPATVTVTLTNAPPSLDSASLSPQEIGTTGTLTASAVSGADPDGDDLSYTYVWERIRNGARQTLKTTVTSSVTDTLDLATEAPGVLGGDVIEVAITASDGHEDSLTRSASVVAGNSAPTADGQQVEVAEDASEVVTLSAVDDEGDDLSYSITTLPTHGSLYAGTATSGSPITTAPFSLEGNTVTYVPDGDYNGSDVLKFRASDGRLDSEVVNVDITVTPINDAPQAEGDSIVVGSGASSTDVDLAELASDVETSDGNLDYEVVSGPTKGTVSIQGSIATYERTPGRRGADAFTFKVTDRGDPDGCDPQASASCDAVESDTAQIDVTLDNGAPAADPQGVTVAEDSSEVITLTGSDPENDGLSFALVTLPAHGTLYAGNTATGAPLDAAGVLDGETLTYVPDAGHNGSDAFDFTVSDGDMASEAATVGITVTPVNDRPTAVDREESTSGGASIEIVLQGSDIDGDDLSFSILDGPSHGSLSALGDITCQDDGSVRTCSASITYAPGAGFGGEDGFTYVVNDGSLDSEGATVAIDVAADPVDPDPVCGDPIEVEAKGDPVVGTPCGELIIVHAGVDAVIVARGGNDTIRVDGTGSARIQAGAGDDRVFCNDASAVVFGKGGADVIRCGAGADSIFSGPGADDVSGGRGTDKLSGGAGKDRLNGKRDADGLVGGGGADRMYGGADNDTVRGKGGSDLFLGGLGNDRINGGGGNDRGRGDAGDDTMFGGRGRDFLRGMIGNDLIIGNGAKDHLQGGTGSDVLKGGSGGDFLKGRDGDDVLVGGGGADFLRGLPGNDDLRGGPGSNRLDGGTGVDGCSGAGKRSGWTSCEAMGS